MTDIYGRMQNGKGGIKPKLEIGQTHYGVLVLKECQADYFMEHIALRRDEFKDIAGRKDVLKGTNDLEETFYENKIS